MLKGIDISNHQKNINLPAVLPNVDFVIVKATGGLSFVDAYCDKFVQQCIKAGKPWGFYHFGKDKVKKTGTGREEADYFYSNCKNYFGHGIPVLDWEMNSMSVAWVNEFVSRIHELTSIWPWIYANPWRFNQGSVNKNCARWIAQYPSATHPTLNYDPGKLPKTDGLIACWQFASDGRVEGYSGNLDINHFYGDVTAWNKYAGVNSTPPIPEIVDKPSRLENDEYVIEITRK